MNHVGCQKTIIELNETDFKRIIAEHLDVPTHQIVIEYVIGGYPPQVILTRVIVDHNLKFAGNPRD